MTNSSPDRPDRGSRRSASADAAAYLQPVFSAGQRRKYVTAVGVAIGAAVFFWTWWLQPSHILGWGRFAVATAVLVWLHFLVGYFFFFFLRARKPADHPADALPRRVAMVVTKAPSEPFPLVRETLEAMLAQDYPYPFDVWIADEAPTPEVLDWCAAHGVKVSSRKDRPDYHRKTWPRRTRCKEGNLAFFYDHYGYDTYNAVSQLDADHVPQPGYLREMMKPFVDPGVGYVSAPSICAANEAQSWAARTRLHTEALFHGVFQGGYSAGWAPMCIGSHYAVRTSALREVGGLGPELAEDHSTSMIFNSHGWRGVHAMDAIAVGAGPGSISDMATQEFQWSRSLVTLLLQHTPRYLSGLTPRLRFQFLFSQLLYPCIALSQLAIFLMPIVALVTDTPFAAVTWPAFVLHAAPLGLVLTWIALQARRDGAFRPRGAALFSWEKIFFVFLQWPWVLVGCVSAVWDAVTRSFVDFRITPKGDLGRTPLPWRVVLPYAGLAAASLAAILSVEDVAEASGFYLLALFNAFMYTLIVAVIVVKHPQENDFSIREAVRDLLPHGAVAAALVVAFAAGGALRGLEGLHGITTGAGALQVTEVRYLAAGAGQGQGRYSIGFKPVAEWGRQGLDGG